MIGLKKKLELNSKQKRVLIEPGNQEITIQRQCELINLNRSSYYLKPGSEGIENLKLMRLIDEEYTKYPFYGTRRMKAVLAKKGYEINRKKIQRLMSLIGIQAIYPKPKLSQGNQNKKYPYLLRDVIVAFPNHVWSTDITYIRMKNGYLYLTAILDWYSRYVIVWELANSLEETFCLNALDEALKIGVPEIFNTDQGVQYTSFEFTNKLEKAGIKISMDGKGRALDNVFVERLWRNVKYEEIYLNEYKNVSEVYCGLEKYFKYYNERRPHQSLKYKTPKEIYFNECSYCS